MRIKYTDQNFAASDDGVNKRKQHEGLLSRINLEKTHIVYGITVNYQKPWYYICDKVNKNYPRWYPGNLFEVTDPRLSKYWVYSYKRLSNFTDADPIITFPEWANNHPDFYDKLSDDEDEELEIFTKYKKLMDVEFPDPSIIISAEIIDDNWLFCPLCIDGWESSDNLDALVICPKCKNILNNPRYKNKFPNI